MKTDEDSTVISVGQDFMSNWLKVRNTSVGFGKHKGTPWKDIPSGYLNWLGKQNLEYKVRSGVVRHRNSMCARLELQFRNKTTRGQNGTMRK